MQLIHKYHNSLDLIFRASTEELGLNNHWLFWKNTFTKHLVIPSSNNIYYRHRTTSLLCSVVEACLLANQGPDLIQVDSWTVELILRLMKVAHTNFPKVSWMVFVHQGTVVMLPSGLSATSRMLSMFSNSSMACTDVSSLLPGLFQVGCHYADQ